MVEASILTIGLPGGGGLFDVARGESTFKGSGLGGGHCLTELSGTGDSLNEEGFGFIDSGLGGEDGSEALLGEPPLSRQWIFRSLFGASIFDIAEGEASWMGEVAGPTPLVGEV
ncbi:hypothetical protein Nepgr_033618 [Nepenthes gracilis]|uniref:Uncharacterized protein n=1 Tax=Nepenthes gracilis TaxID=150966 RepID=A0AAD3TMD6_NEPGR|nr:hypothetical protein Nepgr_033618 [Nepenthes gracilis]